MSQSKQLLVPWLMTQINSGKYPGVQWTNVEKKEFCIPWKHALRQDSSDTDFLIFKTAAHHQDQICFSNTVPTINDVPYKHLLFYFYQNTSLSHSHIGFPFSSTP
uniref:IRF tryptophan pentad repeat domain-containing protein n=1 Tax=Cynoglossus semilaevis TaxID=244447 RepID=A0A3P8WQS3_CYNSE